MDKRVVVLTVVSVACGLPLYLAIESASRLPLWWRDRPWPLAIVVAAAAVITIVHVGRTLRARRGRVLAIACTAIQVASAIGFAVFIARRYQLPPSARGLELGAAVDFALPDHTGRPVQLASLRGRPVLLYFYRGSS